MTKQSTHLAILRAIALRASVGSALLKGWSALNVSGLIAVASDPLHARFAWLAVFLTLLFWTLDAYFLRQKRLYGKACERVSTLGEADVDFSLSTAAVDSEADTWSSVMFSKGPVLFYGAVIGLIGLARWMAQDHTSMPRATIFL